MIHLFDAENAELLAQLASARVLLAFDFDGTLAPIVAEPQLAFMRATTSKLFKRVCDLYPSAVISGRSRADVSARLAGARVGHVIGNHGLEPSSRLPEFQANTKRAAMSLRQSLSSEQGVELEDKRYSLALHYRDAKNKEQARKAIREAVAALPLRVRTVSGKLVVNIVPEGAPNKGDALLALRGETDLDVALYVGDDVTDEDVFEIDQPGRLVGVRVGESRGSAAGYFLRDQREIDRLLRQLIALRENRSKP